jgi:hypothetical protein
VEEQMVMLSSTWPLPTYEVYDERGRRIGRVVMPRDSAVIGIHAGTVFLARPMPAAGGTERRRD